MRGEGHRLFAGRARLAQPGGRGHHGSWGNSKAQVKLECIFVLRPTVWNPPTGAKSLGGRASARSPAGPIRCPSASPDLYVCPSGPPVPDGRGSYSTAEQMLGDIG
jgi:hypothetical protein